MPPCTTGSSPLGQTPFPGTLGVGGLGRVNEVPQYPPSMEGCLCY